MHVAAVLKRKGSDVVTIGPDRTILEAANLLTRHRIGAVVVVSASGEPVGILSERDIIRGISKHGEGILRQPVETLMTRNLLTCRPDNTIDEVMALMSERRVRHLPVLDSGRLVGLVSIGDVVKQRLDEAALEVETLRGYVTGA